MKKIFTLLTAIMLMWSGSVWSVQNVEAQHFDWSEFTQTWNYYLDNGNVRRLDGYKWAHTSNSNHYLRLIFFHQKGKAVSYTVNNQTITFPNKGTYTLSCLTSTNTSSDVITTYDSNIDGWKESYLTIDGSSAFTLSAHGTTTVTVSEGVDGPYISFPSSVQYEDAKYYYTQDGLTIGSPAVYRSVNVVSENTSKGTVNYEMKSGYVYTKNITNWKNGSTWTLTATPEDGYRFVCWKKGNTTISSYPDNVVDVQITGDATYTAYFEYDGPMYTINVVTTTPEYCTVSGGGDYIPGTTANISSTSKNPHVYVFDTWEEESTGEDAGTPSFPITVTKNDTYTVSYRLANPGTISANASPSVGGSATVIQSSTAGGTAVTLTAEANDGYTFTGWDDDNDGTVDNTDPSRTVYVDGNKAYAAVFEQAVVVYLEEGSARGSSNWCEVSGYNDDYSFSFNFDEAFSDGEKNYTTMDNSTTNYSWIQATGGAKKRVQNGYVVSINYNSMFRRAILDATCQDEDGVKYQVRIVTNKLGNAYMYNDVEESGKSAMGNNAMTFSYSEAEVTKTATYLMVYINRSVPDDYGSTSYQAAVFFNISGEQISGVYPIRGTAAPGTMTVGGYQSGEGLAGTWAYYDCKTSMQQGTGLWLLRSGEVTLQWKDENHYYIQVNAYGSSGNNVKFNIGNPNDVISEHTVSITPPTNGTITVSYNNGSGQSFTSGSRDIAEGTVLTVTTSPSEGYHFDGWTNDGAASVTVNGDKTIGATFAANAYTVTFNKNNESATGSMDNQAFTYGTAQNLSDNGFIAPTGMHFTGWATEENGAVVYTNKEEVSNLTATQNGEVELFAKWAYNTYTVVFNKNNEDATGTMANQAFTYGTAQNLTPNGFTSPDPERYDFAGWATEENGAVVYTNGEEVTNLTAEHEGTVTLYAKWIEAFALIDDKDAGNSYYDETLAGKVGQTLSVHYMREFPKKQWAAFSLPFGYSYQKKGNNTFKDQVYYLISAEYEVEGGKAYLTLNCMPNTLGIVANKPYILIPNETIVNPVFNNVKMKAQALNYYSVPCTNIGVADPVETVEFRNTLTRMQFANDDHRQIYLVGSKLRYPNDGTHIRAFRGYFYMQEGTIQHIQPRLRNAETGEIIEAEEETNTTVETKKYIENGILVIERAGMKYDAQGHVIK